MGCQVKAYVGISWMVRGLRIPAPSARAELTVRLLMWRQPVSAVGAEHLIQSHSFAHQHAQQVIMPCSDAGPVEPRALGAL